LKKVAEGLGIAARIARENNNGQHVKASSGSYQFQSLMAQTLKSNN